MTDYLIFWGVSAVAVAVFFAYWVWRFDRNHRRRMQSIAEAEAADRVWMAEAAKFRAEHMAWVAQTEPHYEDAVAEPASR